MSLRTAPSLVLLAASALTAGCGGSPQPDRATSSAAVEAVACSMPLPYERICDRTPPASGAAKCHALRRVGADGTPETTQTPTGLGATDLRDAYALPASGGDGRVVAVVEAFHDPTAEADLAVYRATYGLPPCTSASGCLQVRNQKGQPSPLPSSSSWGAETALDLDMLSAGCPDCSILLVEADSNSNDDLAAAVQTAAAYGASAVSSSYYGPETAATPDLDKLYDHPGVLVVASAGDSGFGAAFPASSEHVLAVGGTTLARGASGWSETAWSGGGSGCSAYAAKPAWQKDALCARRTIADVAAVADPDHGVAVYTTTGGSGWGVYGGTSAAAPLVAAMFTLLDIAKYGPSYPYAHPGALRDVVSGSNGTCGKSYLCEAGPGYDGPTGLGAPVGHALAADVDAGAQPPEPPGAAVPPPCSHGVCVRGQPLVLHANACVDAVCAADAACCSTQWDAACIEAVNRLCAQTCTAEVASR